MSDAYLEKLMRSEKKRYFHFVYIAILLLAAFFYAYQNFQIYFERQSSQKAILEHAVIETENRLKVYFSNLKRSLLVYVHSNQNQLDSLFFRPDDEHFINQVNRSLKEYFDEYLSFNLSDQNGDLVLDVFQEVFGEQCRSDMKYFVETGKYKNLKLHPNYDHVHFDIQIPIQTNQSRGYLLAIFSPQSIIEILKTYETLGNHLYLVNKNNIQKIEISTVGHRLQLTDEGAYISDEHMQMLDENGFRVSLAGSDWDLIGLPNFELIASQRNNLLLQLVFIVIGFIIVALGGFYLQRRELNLRLEAQNELFIANLNLEIGVQERTLELEKSLELNRLTFEQAGVGIAHVDIQGNFLKVNDAFCDFLFYKREQLLKKNVRDITYPADIARDIQSIKNAIEENTRRFQYEKRYIRADRSIVWGKVTASLVNDENASNRFFVVVIEDIDVRKHAEEGMRYLQSNLEDMVHERTLEAEESRKKAEKSEKAKAEFLANMSHEIRTPLNAVLGFAQIGLRQSGNSPSQLNYQRILQAGEHLLNLINDILDLSKIEAGKLELDLHTFDQVEMIKQIAEMFQHQVKKKDLELKFHYDENMPRWVFGDSHRIRQVLLNILSNAVKFTDKGTIEFYVTFAKITGLMQFHIADSGIGMTQDQLKTLFRPFEQADSTTTRKYGGTGLGMSISYDLVSLMNGIIDVNSEAGKGTEFVISLNLPESTAEQAEGQDVNYKENSLLGLQVLLVDDLEMNRLVAEDMLSHEGAQVTLADSGEKAVNLVSKNPEGFDLVLMDIQMPGMDGREATAKILKITDQLPIIGLTAHASQEERVLSLEAGMVDQITKPLIIENLISKIIQHLPGHFSKQVSQSEQKPVSGEDTSTVAKPNSDSKATIEENDVEVEAAHSPEASVSLVDWQSLSNQYDGRDKFIQKLARSFWESNHDLPEKMVLAIEKADYETVRFIAHKVKGASANLFALDLNELAKQLELAAVNSQEDVKRLGANFNDLLQKVLDEIEQRLPE